MTVYHNENRHDTSNVELRDNKIIRYEKNSQSKEMQHIDYGLSILSHSALDNFDQVDNFDLAEVFYHLVASKEIAAYRRSLTDFLKLALFLVLKI